MNLIAGFGSTLPIFLGLVPLGIGALVYIYMRRGRGPRVVVSSSLVLKKLSRPAEARKKFFPPVRFILEAVLVLLAALGAADIFLKEDGRRIALVIDNSLSMTAASPNSPGETTLYKAIDQAHAALDEFKDSDRVAVFAGLEMLGSDSLTPTEARGAIERLAAKYTADDISGEIQRLNSDGRWDKIVVFTDREVDVEDGGKAGYSGRVQIRTLGGNGSPSRPENVAITGIKYRKGADGQKSIAVEVSVFAKNSKKAAVRLRPVSSRGEALTSQEIDISTDAPREITFPIPESLGEVFKAELSLGDSSVRASDSIAADNEAYIGIDSEQGEIAVVSESSLVELGLGDFRAASLKHVSPEKVSDDPKVLNSFAGAIFYKAAPNLMPPLNAAFILPPQTDFTPRITEVSSAAPTRWKKNHPLLTYADVSELRFSAGLSFSPLVWTEEVLSTTAGPVLTAGETNNRKYAFIGFEILPFEGRRAPFLSVLALNIFKWISSVDSNQGWLPLGALSSAKSKMLAAAPESARLKGPGPGIYEIRADSGSRAIRAFNFFSKDESDVFSPTKITVSLDPMPAADTKDSNARLIGGLARAALVLILLEALFSLFSAQKKRRGARGAA